MSNYVPRYSKKRESLARKELDLRRLILRGGSEEKVIAGAEEVRASRIRALKAKRATIPPKGGPEAGRVAAIEAKIEALLAMPVAAILAEFRDASIITEDQGRA